MIDKRMLYLKKFLFLLYGTTCTFAIISAYDVLSEYNFYSEEIAICISISLLILWGCVFVSTSRGAVKISLNNIVYGFVCVVSLIMPVCFISKFFMLYEHVKVNLLGSYYSDCLKRGISVGDAGVLSVCDVHYVYQWHVGTVYAVVYDATGEIEKRGEKTDEWITAAQKENSNILFGKQEYYEEKIQDHFYRVTFSTPTEWKNPDKFHW